MSQNRQAGGRQPRFIECVRKTYLTPHFVRVTFTGDDLKGFPSDENGAAIKVFFPNQQSGTLELPHWEGDQIVWPENKPASRAYTIRYYRPETNELDIDFVVHGTESPGSGWAMRCQPGDQLGLAGPGQKPALPVADRYILAGDLTALPAMSAVLESLPEDAVGHALIEIDHPEDQHALTHPAGIDVRWLVRHPEHMPYPLIDAVQSAGVPQGMTVSAFIAGENRTVIACRKFMIETFQLTKKNMYAIPYWRRGKSEEKYHDERHEIMDETY
ncbi:Vibriobactin utilization protein ViuB [Vibrio aerogenes CECT 7868]|uniref:Vibriobactin utilization protein ViuB n=1 Tax=Vibrio aerogenes CECT 7868 TaxID=1216006 RepID=A0A1M5VUS3_9VIBR|nr:siderophore-interacting protein [Vibrio aerogenes]SHH78673.1 Vibriobactin utilization protein ViuB [Vibrio aerogenes CECT 7868]